MIDLTRIEQQTLATDPYEWTLVDGLFAPDEAEALAAAYPREHFKTVQGFDGEKGYVYKARSLISMGASPPSYAEELSPVWQQPARELISRTYRAAMTKLTGRDLISVPIEVNVFQFTPGSWLGQYDEGAAPR